jgi:hypothetical protein
MLSLTGAYRAVRARDVYCLLGTSGSILYENDTLDAAVVDLVGGRLIFSELLNSKQKYA